MIRRRLEIGRQPRDLAMRNCDYRTLRMLRMAPFERRAGGWRFGTKRVADHVVERLVTAGRATVDGDIVRKT